jgi:hypothetical protein
VPSLPSAWTVTLRWLVVLVPLVDLALVLTGVLDVRTGVLVGLALELVLLVVVVAEFRVFRRAYRAARAQGRTRGEAAGAGCRAVWPPVVVALAEAEVGLWRSLWWAVRRRRDVGPDDVAISYSDRFTVMLWGVCCLGALEVVVVHVLTARWPVVRWGLLALGIYALVWFVSFGLSLRQRPHVLSGDRLVLRFGWFRALHVPLSGLAAVRTGAVTGHRRNLVLDGDDLTMSVMGDTNLELRFDPPVEVDVAGASHEFSRIAVYADDPRAVAALLRGRALSTGD